MRIRQDQVRFVTMQAMPSAETWSIMVFWIFARCPALEAIAYRNLRIEGHFVVRSALTRATLGLDDTEFDGS